MTALARIDELRADRATVGLSPAELAEFEAVLGHDPDLDASSLELTAAAIELACFDTDATEALPDAVRDGLRRQASHFSQAQTRRLATVTPIDVGRGASGIIAESATDALVGPSTGASTVLPWLAAAAAALIAAVGWFRPVEPTAPAVEPPVVAETPAPEPTPSVERQLLLTSGGDALQLPWTATEDPASQGATGDLVWSNTEQRGYMRFEGLQPNDPTVTRYQLWIFDGTRDDRYPIDGGLFDVQESGEVVVPIDARLDVSKPVLFAITVEQPEGVVVSDRERIVLVAQSST